jgi:polygalacturonase
MGTESGGGFQNITVINCTICSSRYSKVIYGRQRGLAGVALEIVDGGTLDRVALSNLTIKGVSVPIFMRLGNRARPYEKDQPKPGIGRFCNVVVSNIIATDCSSIGCSITGLPGHPIENISLSNINLGFEGGGTKDQASREIPEKPTSYPESTMFGTLPAYGFFCRHAKNIKFQNVKLDTSTPDHRYAIVFDDVEHANVESLDVSYTAGSPGTIRLDESRYVYIRNCQPQSGTELFLDVRGPRSKNIVLFANDLSGVKKILSKTANTPESAVVLKANYLSQK